MGLRLARARVRFWEVRGYLSEGRSYLAEALGQEAREEPRGPAPAADRCAVESAAPPPSAASPALGVPRVPDRESGQRRGPGPGSKPPRVRAKALNGAAKLAWMQGDSGAARTFCGQSLAIEQTSGDQWGIAWSIHQLGRVAYNHGLGKVAREQGDPRTAAFRCALETDDA
jgi:hypothetical protein